MSKICECNVCNKIFKRIADAESYGATIMGQSVLAFLKTKEYIPNAIDLCPECSEGLKNHLQKWWKKAKK